MERIFLAPDFSISRIVHGHWRLASWNLSTNELRSLVETCLDLGITTFDHADIYGNYSCESILGDVLKKEPGLRNRIELITKCGIKLKSDKFPERRVKYYDYSADHIISSVEKSLENFGTDHVDALLLHRPAPFFDLEEVAYAFQQLKREGKVLQFGVSNFSHEQFELLNAAIGGLLCTNQVEISPYCLEHFNNGNMDYFVKEEVSPMAWSPLGGGKIFNPDDARGRTLLDTLQTIAYELGFDPIDKLIYAWLLAHPAKIVPIVGSKNPERIKHAVDALDISMSLEQWYRIFIAGRGSELP